MSPPYKVGIVGYGLSAKIFHIPFIIALPSSFKLHAVVQRSPKPDDDVTKDWPGVKRYSSTEELVGDAEVDLIVLGSTPESHFELAKLCLEGGKHCMWFLSPFLLLYLSALFG